MQVLSVEVLDEEVFTEEADYNLVVITESRNETMVVTGDNCTRENNCSYIFSSDNITTSSTVNVEVVGCTTETFMAENISSCKKELKNSGLTFLLSS